MREHRLVRGLVGANDHLRALAGRSEDTAFLARLRDPLVHLAHRGLDGGRVLLRRQALQAGIRGELDIDRQPIGPEPGLLDEPGTGLGDRLQMDVTGEAVRLPQRLRHQHHLLHRVVGGADNAGGEEQALDVVALVEIERELHHLVHAEARPPHVRRAPVDAIGAIEQAVIGQQDFQQRHAAPVRRVGMADATRRGRADAAGRRLARRRPG